MAGWAGLLFFGQRFDDFHHRQVVETALGATNFTFDPTGMALLGFLKLLSFFLDDCFGFVEDTEWLIVQKAHLTGFFLFEPFAGSAKLLAGSQAKKSSHLFDGLFELFILQLQDFPLSDEFCLAETFKLGSIKLGFLSVHALFHMYFIL